MAFGSSYKPTYSVGTKIARLAGEWEVHAKTLSLTPSQARFAKRFFTGANLLASGEAGTGKSYLVQSIIAFLTQHGVNVGVTGLTGVSAFLIGGQTLHSFAGVGLADEPVSNLLTKLYKNRKAKDRIKATEVLFIDEVSMAKGDLLNKVNEVFKVIRYNDAAFGGVQLICSADWLQLTPVFKGDEVQELAFQSAAWEEAKIETVVLKEQMRQRGDPTFRGVLSDVRVGETKSLPLLEARIGATFPADGIEAVRIFCRNVDVDRYNAERLAALPGAVKTYTARDTGMPHHTDAFNKNCPAPQILDLKVGANVRLLVNENVEEGYVNGALGVVKAFGPEGVTVQFQQGTLLVQLNEWTIKEQEVGVDGKLRFKTVATRRQMPLRLSWASTIHKCQGQTIDRAILDVGDAFSDGMVYVALSRVRNLESLSLSGRIPASAIRVNQAAVEFYEAIERAENPF
jgi:ATP-dependent exoDNAse (exonuclease V) alpha subunit